MKPQKDERIKTGLKNLDAVLMGGLPPHAVTVFGGSPGSGKTILSQQICFANATPQRPAVIFNTLSEPTPKTLRYLRPFSFFREDAIGKSVHFVDLGSIMRTKGLAPALQLMMSHVRRIKPAFVVVDSFKVFDELSTSREDLRKFTYEVAISLMAWECTSFLIGEFGPKDIESNPLFSIVDGIVVLSTRESGGEQQRFLQVMKMRGTGHSREHHAMSITSKGMDVYAPRVTIRRSPEPAGRRAPRRRLGIAGVDSLLGAGIPSGSSILISGASGTGKTLFALESVYRGAKDLNEKGLLFTFDETPDRLLATGRDLGWNLDREIKRGMLKIVHIPQADIIVEENMLTIEDQITAFGAQRVAIDSVSVFFYKITALQELRERMYQLATIVQRAGAVGLFTNDVAFGTSRVSRFGVEETIVDGIIVLTMSDEELETKSFLQVYKLRNTKHRRGRHVLTVGRGGLHVTPRPE